MAKRDQTKYRLIKPEEGGNLIRQEGIFRCSFCNNDNAYCIDENGANIEVCRECLEGIFKALNIK